MSILLRRDEEEELPNERELRDLEDEWCAAYPVCAVCAVCSVCAAAAAEVAAEEESLCCVDGEAGRTGFLPTGLA